MDDVRKGQIAFLFLKQQLRRKGIRLASGFKRKIEKEAEYMGISLEEAKEFAESIVQEIDDRSHIDPVQRMVSFYETGR